MDMYNCIQKYLTPPAIVVIYKSEMNIFSIASTIDFNISM